MLGERIKKRREELGLTQSQIADKLDMTAANFSSYERGKSTPPVETLYEIAKVLHTNIDWLLEKSDDPIPVTRNYSFNDDGSISLESEKDAKLSLLLSQRNKLSDTLKTMVEDNALGAYNELIEATKERIEKLNSQIEEIRNDYQYPSFATSKDKRDFKKMLEEDAPVMFDGVPLTDEDKEKIQKMFELLFWDAKRRNKRKPVDE